MKDDSAEVLSQSVLQKALVSGSGIGQRRRSQQWRVSRWAISPPPPLPFPKLSIWPPCGTVFTVEMNVTGFILIAAKRALSLSYKGSEWTRLLHRCHALACEKNMAVTIFFFFFFFSLWIWFVTFSLAGGSGWLANPEICTSRPHAFLRTRSCERWLHKSWQRKTRENGTHDKTTFEAIYTATLKKKKNLSGSYVQPALCHVVGRGWSVVQSVSRPPVITLNIGG